MSFHNTGLWMAKTADSVTDGEMAYDDPVRGEPKRSHQWFTDGVEAEFFPNKRQTVEVPSNNFLPGLSNLNVSPWGSISGFQSVPAHFTERLFDSETAKTSNFEDRNIPSIGTGNMNMNLNMGSKIVADPFGIDSSFGLSMSHNLDDPRSAVNYSGIRKVKVCQVKDSENVMSTSTGPGYSRGDEKSVSEAHTFNKIGNTCVSMGLSYNGGDEDAVTVGSTFAREGTSFTLMTQHYNKGSTSTSIGHPYQHGNENISVGHGYTENSGNISVGQSFSKCDNTVISIGQDYNKEDSNVMSTGCISVGDAKASLSNYTYNGVFNHRSSLDHSYRRGGTNIISFGGVNADDEADPSGRLLCSYEMLMGQSSVHSSETPNERNLAELNALAVASQVTASGAEIFSKKKEEQKPAKKVPQNNFPSNVRSLLSTGMLDGVPVKYIAWSREKELRGVIKGSGYLCGCQSCNLSKIINAYEFERHAGCKTKHPNNHIYFENGKTIYGIVQELRSTPQNLLFEVIQTITGSPINQKSFCLWKESFLAATRELQRIYGKDEAKQLC